VLTELEVLKFCLNGEITRAKTTSTFSMALGYTRPPLWSSGQGSWLQIRMPGFDSRHYQEKKKKSSGSGTGSSEPREFN
jgi:hypothetical protein